MTTRAAFNGEEWAVIANAPYLAALLIIGTSRGGRMRETLAIAEAYAAARQHYRDELLQQLFTTSPSFDPTTAHTGEELHDEALGTLRRAVSLLERTATEAEVNLYKRFVYYLAETVARAHREGSFLGIGGQEISDGEQAVLDEIAELFDEPPRGGSLSAS